MAVVNSERRAKVCGARATTERTVYGATFNACADCAAHVDAAVARGADPKARELAPPFDYEADARKRWDEEQAKLPPGKRRTYDQAADDDEKRLGAKIRRGRKRGLL